MHIDCTCFKQEKITRITTSELPAANVEKPFVNKQDLHAFLCLSKNFSLNLYKKKSIFLKKKHRKKFQLKINFYKEQFIKNFYGGQIALHIILKLTKMR